MTVSHVTFVLDPRQKGEIFSGLDPGRKPRQETVNVESIHDGRCGNLRGYLRTDQISGGAQQLG
jgi:hypothetical protein